LKSFDTVGRDLCPVAGLGKEGASQDLVHLVVFHHQDAQIRALVPLDGDFTLGEFGLVPGDVQIV
jgi:hypothetical protein